MRRAKTLFTLAAAGTAIGGYLAWRPRLLRWDATREEAAEALPG
jgi:hypothetical protein